jgi:GntR family transcriptional repressor for pyruvate dehydrogenase complex
VKRVDLALSPSAMRRERLHEQIADQIESMIVEDQLQPGWSLPPERELAQRLGVNRMTVRQGLYLLQQRGLIDVKVGSGSYLTSMAPSVVADSIGRYFVFGRCSHRELAEVREALEPQVAALAAEHATSEDLARLQTLVEQLEASAAKADIGACVLADLEFHLELAAASKNKLLIAVMSGLRQVMSTWLQTQIERAYSEVRTRGHRLVYEAIASHDAERARDEMRVHIREAYLSLLDKEDTPAAGSGE